MDTSIPLTLVDPCTLSTKLELIQTESLQSQYSYDLGSGETLQISWSTADNIQDLNSGACGQVTISAGTPFGAVYPGLTINDSDASFASDDLSLHDSSVVFSLDASYSDYPNKVLDMFDIEISLTDKCVEPQASSDGLIEIRYLLTDTA